MIIDTGEIPNSRFSRLYDIDSNNKSLSPISKLVISFLRRHTLGGPKDIDVRKMAWTLRLNDQEANDALIHLSELGLISIESERV